MCAFVIVAMGKLSVREIKHHSLEGYGLHTRALHMSQLLFADNCLLAVRTGKRLFSSKKYEEKTDRESSNTDSWDSNKCIPGFFPLVINCNTVPN